MNQFNLNNKKKILVTGASGFLGNELIKQLLNEGDFHVIAMTSKVNELKEKYTNNYITVVSSQTWKSKLKEDSMHVDILINCAFPRSSDPEVLALGIPFTEQLIKDSIDFGIKNIINISSQSVYTQKDKEDVTEQSNVQPESLYGMSKFACERVVTILSEEANINFSNIRLGSLTGINFDVRMTNRFVKSAIAGEKIIITGGQQKISYLDVRDAAKGLIKMLYKDPIGWNNIYNLGSKEHFTLIELVETIKEEAKEHSLHNIVVEVQDGDSNFNNVMNNNLFYEHFSFQPYYNFKKMINELFTYQLEK